MKELELKNQNANFDIDSGAIDMIPIVHNLTSNLDMYPIKALLYVPDVWDIIDLIDCGRDFRLEKATALATSVLAFADM